LISTDSVPATPRHLLPQFLGKDPLFYGGLLAIIGVSLAHFSDISTWIWATSALAIIALAFFWKRGRVVVLGAVLAGFAGVHEWREHIEDEITPIWEGQDLHSASAAAEVFGTVVATPRPPRSGDLWRLTVKLDAVETTSDGIRRRIETENRIHVFTPGFLARQGDRIVVKGVLKPLPLSRNPGEFSRSAYARDSEGVVAEMRVLSRLRLEVVGTNAWYRMFDLAFRTRNAVGRKITAGLDPRSEQAQILKAMTLGARDEADPEVEEPFRLSGALHIFAVSGLHVGIFGTVIWFLLRAFLVPRRGAIFVIILCVLAYAFITGLRPSAVRAAIMTSVFLAGFCLRKKSRLLNSLGFAALVILAVDTRQLFSVGFQLSFAVLTCISLFTPFLSRISARWLDTDPFIPNSLIGKGQRLAIQGGKRVCDVFWVSLAASVGSTGFVLWYFGLLTPIAVLANCVLVPLAWFVICIATVSLVIGNVPIVGGFTGRWLNWVNSYLVSWIYGAATFFAQTPNGHFEVTPLSERFKSEVNEPGVVVFDLGRSCGPQAINLKDEASGETRTWFIDSGHEASYKRVIRPWLRKNGIDRLDGLIASHGDVDHIGSAVTLIEEFRPNQLVQSQLPSSSKSFKNLEKFKAAGDVSVLQLAAGARIELGTEAAIKILYPPASFPDQSAGDDECLVVMLEWNGFRILNMSDSGFRTENWLLENVSPEDLRADVLVKSHHLADFSGLAKFLRAVDPKAVIATNDRFSANESIEEDWQQLLESTLGIALFDQAECGAVTMKIQGDRLKLEGFVNGQEFKIVKPAAAGK
jgi:competence protein ComEC